MEVIILDDLVITPLIKAKNSLEAALAAPETDLTRDASIQRFEYTFELTWKTLKRILKYKGLIVNNPHDVIRESAKQGYIDDPESWFEFLADRNQTVHIYNEAIAQEIYDDLDKFTKELNRLLDKISLL